MKYAIKSIYIVSTIVALQTPYAVFAEGFDSLDNHKDLINSTVLEVGEAIRLDAAPNKNEALVAFSGRCFKGLDHIYWASTKRAALLVMDKPGSTKIAFIDSNIGSISIKTADAYETNCPSGVNVGYSSDPQKNIERNALEQRYYEQKKEDSLKSLELRRQKYQKLMEDLKRQQNLKQ